MAEHKSKAMLSSLPFLAVVSLVAVVAVVILVLNSGSSESSLVVDEEGNVVGAAFSPASALTSSLKGAYYRCLPKAGSTTGGGTNIYTANPDILTNQVTVECAPKEEVLISDFTCNPHEWSQKIPVFVSGVSFVTRTTDEGRVINGRTLTCTGGESQGILNVLCCKKS